MKIRFEAVSKHYGDFKAVDNLNLEIKESAMHFLLGPSGCGKTTTLRMLAGLEKVTAGKILFNDVDVTNISSAERNIGMVFQNYALWPHMTVRKNIEYGLKIRKLSAELIAQRVNEVLTVTKLENFKERLPGQLSGGQQQRVALARALAIRPKVLLFDEPLSNLDAKLRIEVRDTLLNIHDQTKITTVYVTHDQKEALSMGTSISVMRAGNLIQTDDPKTLYKKPLSPFIANFIGETNLIEATVVDKTTLQTPIGELKTNLSNHDISKDSKCSISIRPEAIRISFDNKTKYDCNNFTSKIKSFTYLGEIEQFILTMPSGALFKSNVYNAPNHNFIVGNKINIHINPDDVLVLPFDSNISSDT